MDEIPVDPEFNEAFRKIVEEELAKGRSKHEAEQAAYDTLCTD